MLEGDFRRDSVGQEDEDEDEKSSSDFSKVGEDIDDDRSSSGGDTRPVCSRG
jgi:hypothetical protein